jgi:hypothetical protein
MAIHKIGVLCDCHFPYIDRKAYNLAIGVLKKVGINELILNGDFADFYGLNSHGENLNVRESFDNEIDSIVHELGELGRIFPDAKRIFICGNHEFRLERYITNEAKGFHNIVTIEKILFLKELGYEFIPYGPSQSYKVSTLNIRHEPVGGGENFACATVKKAGASVLFGHHHQIQEHQKVTIDGSYHRAISVGCLCDKNHPVMNYVKNFHQWQLGFAIITVINDKTWFCQNIHIIPGDKYRCQANGKIYEI